MRACITSSAFACGAAGPGSARSAGTATAGGCAAVPTTALAERASATWSFSCAFNWTAADEVRNPSLLAIKVYRPGLRFTATNAPSGPLTRLWSLLSFWLCINTWASGKGAPSGLRVTPRMTLTPTCAQAGTVFHAMHTGSATVTSSLVIILIDGICLFSIGG